ncbi:MAG TPA: winged helix-turn-helix domain-containing protein [Armatimonadota bacterium]|jgi:hypothetical protein
MAYNSATWDWEGDGYRRGPRHAPVLDNLFAAAGLVGVKELHASLQHPRRVLLVTFLGVRGPTETPVLARELGWALGHLGIVLRGMMRGGLLRSEVVAPRAGRGSGRRARLWSLTETGRWAMWRQAWITRSAFCAPWVEWPPVEGMDEDPVEAVRRWVKLEFLRPASICGLQYMVRNGLVTMREIARALRIPDGSFLARMRMWEREGWVEETRWPAIGLPGQEVWCWLMTDAGKDAVYRHADALRKAAIACGWTPTPGRVRYGPGFSVYEHEREFLEMGWRM